MSYVKFINPRPQTEIGDMGKGSLKPGSSQNLIDAVDGAQLQPEEREVSSRVAGARCRLAPSMPGGDLRAPGATF